MRLRNWRVGKKDKTGEKMIKHKSIYDISVFLGEESIDYPDDTLYSRRVILTHAQSGICDLPRLAEHKGRRTRGSKGPAEGDLR